MDSSFVCATCGGTHEGLPTDHAWQLPDDVWDIPSAERPNRAKYDSDLCQLGDRFFIRCVLKVPFNEQPDSYAWGIWVEVGKSDFCRYLELYDEDGRAEPQVQGRIANAIPGYPPTAHLPVQVQFQDSTNRPTVVVLSTTEHPLVAEQATGIDNVRYHEILVATGSLDGP